MTIIIAGVTVLPARPIVSGWAVTAFARRKRFYIIALLTILAVAGIVILAVPPVLDPYLQGKDGRWLRFWLQTVAGNWSSGQDSVDLIKEKVISDKEFATSAVIAILLNNFLFVIIIGFMWRAITERNRIMEATDALILGSVLTKEALRSKLMSSFETLVSQGIKVFTNDQSVGANVDSLVDDAYKEGREELKLVLRDVVKDEDQLHKIMQIIEKREKNSQPSRL